MVVERIGTRGLGLIPGGVGQRHDSLWFGCCDPRRHAGPLRQLLTRRVCTHDIGFDHDVARAADHQEVFDIVAPDQHQAPPAVHGGGIDHGKTGHPPAIRAGTQPIACESTHQPRGDADQRQHGQKC
jgi:hypothetical protein